MADQSQGSLNELFAEIEEFEKTVDRLSDNLKKFKQKLKENQKKYGADMAKWPSKAE